MSAPRTRFLCCRATAICFCLIACSCLLSRARQHGVIAFVHTRPRRQTRSSSCHFHLVSEAISQRWCFPQLSGARGSMPGQRHLQIEGSVLKPFGSEHRKRHPDTKSTAPARHQAVTRLQKVKAAQLLDADPSGQWQAGGRVEIKCPCPKPHRKSTPRVHPIERRVCSGLRGRRATGPTTRVTHCDHRNCCQRVLLFKGLDRKSLLSNSYSRLAAGARA